MPDQQWQDVLGILKIKAEELDQDYLEKWAAKLEVADLLKRAAAEPASATEGRPETKWRGRYFPSSSSASGPAS